VFGRGALRRAVVMRLGFFAIAALAFLSGCQRPKWDTPVDGFRSFQLALKRGDAKAAWDAISKESRGRIEAKLKAVALASGGVIPEGEAAAMALATGLKSEPLGDVTLKEASGDAAVVLVKVKDTPREQHMVREDGKWRLDLLPLLPES
jgi:hypothetical protein